MNTNYVRYQNSSATEKNINDFQKYLLTQDTIITPEQWDLICSPGVQKKIKKDPEIIKDKYFYRDEEVIYFIYSKYFPGIGDVQVLFDTTSYIKTQIVIIKIGLVFIFLVSVLQFFAGRIISKSLLRNLVAISQIIKKVDINNPSRQRIHLSNLPDDDEIRILADGLNKSHDTIDKQTSKLKQFITDVSHEFKTPLMWMSSRLDVLEKKTEKNSLDTDDVQKFFRDTRQNITKLNDLLESLFFLSRIEEQQSCLMRNDVHVKAMIEWRVKKISESFPYKKLHYTIDIDEALIYQVEKNTFCILLDNLISNAMKFAPENMQITIFANETCFFVQDNGPGIEKEERDIIWEKFYRKDTNKEWFGVGLYLVKRIIDIYDWKVSIESTKWKGTKFKVDIREER